MNEAEISAKAMLPGKVVMDAGVIVRGEPVPADFTADRERFCAALTNEAYLELVKAFGYCGRAIHWEDVLCHLERCRDLLARNGCEFPSYT